ncbi:triacylglycerol lipase KNAG_0A03770 [Huiozyma naganishii CBS 8797]|uniref:AB hydrolase-1 domain-containing protein n=1 Tax=Huiozyma naganishii (strain ATCC MYA-139 / BCRC 22969 / CBS 8797 / KCTC 17520 / NBRC 10181 / NCYC 3082 / Yp74L-3) TaxID=1071383 RepID=J7RTJ7_HUIN7|nr:hypothetical protein KNAG_0A03770 [Kazachstania naganishii CBS 8797]CCK68057.1 hypothetical protein KNAG_0A03770 [Kazachstania naganishii CBS 8797]
MAEDLNRLVREACSLDGEIASGRTLEDIVSSYEDGPTLSSQITDPANAGDFRLNFISTHEQYCTVNGIKVRVCHNLSTANGKTLSIFIHGLGGSLDQFFPLLKLLDLSEKYFVAIDLPGFGKSDEHTDYPMIQVVKHIDAVISELLNEARLAFDTVRLIGHSMGCYLTLHFMTLFSKKYRIGKVVLLAPPKPEMIELNKDKRLVQVALNVLFRVPWVFSYYRTWFDQRKGLQSSGIQQFFRQSESEDSITSHYWKLFQFSNNVQIKSRTIVGYLLGWEPLNWEEIRKTIVFNDVSIYIFSGEMDKVTPIDSCKTVRDAFGKDCKVDFIQLPNCAHNICFDSPEQSTKAFLDSNVTE